MTFEIKTTEIPASARTGRAPLPNPFTDAFPSDDKALTFTLPKSDTMNTDVARVIRQVRSAAKAVNRTGRVVQDPQADGSVKFTVWTVARMTRTPKSENVEVGPSEAEAVANVAKVAAKKTAAKKAPAKTKA